MASPTGEAVLFLLRKAQQEADLFVILGDLFDLWVGKGWAFQKKYKPLLEEFKKLRARCRIIYFEGNHDLHLAKFWQEQLGFEVYTEPKMIQYSGIKIWAEHGDEINRSDHGYLFLRWFLRTPPLKALVHWVPSKLVSQIGEKASSTSRKYTDSLPNQSLEVFREYAKSLKLVKNFDLLLTGHTHIADDFQFDTPKGKARLINLGSWYDGPRYLQISSQGDVNLISSFS